jgi:hypothetical protein
LSLKEPLGVKTNDPDPVWILRLRGPFEDDGGGVGRHDASEESPSRSMVLLNMLRRLPPSRNLMQSNFMIFDKPIFI